jgi:hypothetical protein
MIAKITLSLRLDSSAKAAHEEWDDSWGLQISRAWVSYETGNAFRLLPRHSS